MNVFEQNFATIKDVYPMRDGAQRWAEAKRAVNARRHKGVTWQAMISACVKYRKWCEFRGYLGTPYVQQAATFFSGGGGFDELSAFSHDAEIAESPAPPPVTESSLWVERNFVQFVRTKDGGVAKLTIPFKEWTGKGAPP
jgi:hypothetical protein